MRSGHNIFDEPALFAASQGVILGMASWDLVFETQRPFDFAAADTVYHFYRVLLTGGSPLLLVLLFAIVYGAVFLVRRVRRNPEAGAIASLICFVLMLAIELGVAARAEAVLIGFGQPSLADAQTFNQVETIVMRIRNVHLAMIPLLLLPIWLCRNKR